MFGNKICEILSYGTENVVQSLYKTKKAFNTATAVLFVEKFKPRFVLNPQPLTFWYEELFLVFFSSAKEEMSPILNLFRTLLLPHSASCATSPPSVKN